MTVEELIPEVVALLQREGRISYRMLKRRFALDDDYLEDIKEELIYAKRLAADEDGKVLVWLGDNQGTVTRTVPPPASQAPISYTPPHLAERIRTEQAALEARGASDGKRKTITSLFADLKGSTALIEGLDPEDARAIIDPALQLMMDAVHRYEGYVAQALGDGIFALFGAPIAHEDHPQRALYAALRMQEEMRRYSDQLRLKGGTPLYMRVGINTGEVVVRSIRKDDLHTDYVPVGHSTNLAARMEQMATPGSIVVTAYTYKLTEGYFAFKALGEAQIKGVEEPLNVYEVLGAGPLRTRLQVAARRGLTRFVGRHSELEQMRQALDQAKAGHGQIVGVMGEPGLGKSRLFYEFKLTSQSGCLVLEAYSVSHGKASSYLPVIELLKSYFQIQLQDDERTRRQKVIGKVLELDRSLEETLPYLFGLLGIEEQPSPLQQMDPQIRRRRTFEALKKLFLRESLNQPLILIFEDLHWIDTETQGFLDVLSESVASAKVLLLVNYRPEYRHEWGNKIYYTQLRLTPLGKDEAEELLTFLLGNDVSLKPLKQLILAKTEGTPFFMEEVVQELREQGVLSSDPAVGAWRAVPLPTELHIPTTVQGMLAARVDRLAAEEKALLQQLAVIGREFPLGLVKQVVSQPEDELYQLLSSLQRKEFLYEQPAFPEVEYLFKHALTQEVAYGTVLQDRRKALHEQTAKVMEELYGSSLDDHYSDLAHHYSRSGNAGKAVEYLYLAGQQAMRHSANEETVNYISQALQLLEKWPDSKERRYQELLLQTTLGSAFLVLYGAAASEAGQAYLRARELCHQESEPELLFPIQWGLWAYYVLRGEWKVGQEFGEQFLNMAQDIQDPARLTQGHYILAANLFWLGEFGRSLEHSEQSLSFYDPKQHRAHAFLAYGWDPGVAALCYKACALWVLGYPDQALAKITEALTLSHTLSHPYSVAFTLSFTLYLHWFRREPRAVQERAKALETIATELGFHHMWMPLWQIYGGWALAEQGYGSNGVEQIKQGFASYEATEMIWGMPHLRAILASAYEKAGETERSLCIVAEALEGAQQTGERFYEAELHRLKGELVLQSGVRSPESETPTPQAEAEAEACFHKAIEIASKQSAKSLELRAATSLAHLWQQQGKKDEAHSMLAEIYNWFTEGFDTKDLQEAKTLLEALSQ